MNDHVDSSLQPPKKPAPSAPRIQRCPACQARVSSGSRFCPKCGIEIAEVSVTETRSPTKLEHGPASTEPQQSDVEQMRLPLVGPLAPLEKTSPRPICACGRQLAPDARFCDGCGTRVGPAEPRFQLIGVNPEAQGLTVPLESRDVSIGKAPDCQLAIDHDEYVSRRHARIFRSQGMLFLEDLGSSNGTFLRVRRPIVLELGDELVIGTSVFRLEEVGGHSVPAEEHHLAAGQ
jgi:hypothetical protein